MSNKQKLPEHITAHELLCKGSRCNSVLISERSGLCFAVNINDNSDVSKGVVHLDSGGGWVRDEDVGAELEVGKTIDYEVLLAKYIKFIANCEGTDYLHLATIDVFTDEELNELGRIS